VFAKTGIPSNVRVPFGERSFQRLKTGEKDNEKQRTKGKSEKKGEGKTVIKCNEV
jgi:hypothetical protein